jgi:hypothetical protein
MPAGHVSPDALLVVFRLFKAHKEGHVTEIRTESHDVVSPVDPKISSSNRRTVDAILRHPVAHNLEWSDVITLIEKLGTVEQKANAEFVFQVHAQRHVMHKPHTKDLTGPEVVELRKFLTRAGLFAEPEEEPAVSAASAAPNLMVVMDHHGAKLHDVDVMAADASQHEIKPYDPHHFQHHLTHKDQSREQGQRTAEDPGYYEQISQALAGAGKIVVVGHGTGKSNAAHHLLEYLKSHHGETHRRVVREMSSELSSITTRQLLEMAHEALR